MNANYPLRLCPLFRRSIWGGRRLESVLGKMLPPGDDYSESWELVDHGSDQSVVASGPLSGTTLQRVVRQLGPALLGMHDPLPQFPLLFKFLDAHQHLSVQVHPNDDQARQLTPPDRGKTEAWVVIHADPGSRIFAGLLPGVDRTVLAQAVRSGTVEACLHAFEPKVGDSLLIPAGAVHALGQGVMVAEIQQSSDTTFRLYDWNRVGPDGLPRPLHVQQALEVIDFQSGPLSPQPPQATRESHVERLVSCAYFTLDRWQVRQPCPLGGDNRFHIVVVLEGLLRIERDAADRPAQRGETVLLPAAASTVELLPVEPTTLLDIYLPAPSHRSKSSD